MKVLVAGGAGFIGSHLAEFYAKKGYDVLAFDNLSRPRTAQYNWDYLKRNYKNVELIKGDVAVFDEVKNYVDDVDAIIHAAAQVAVTTSMENPRDDFNTNVLGTFNILEAARQTNTTPAIVYCSTNKVYGENVNKIPIKDNGHQYVLDKNRLRPTELPILIGDNSKAKELLGWEPTIPLEKTIEDMIAWQLAKI